VTCPIRGESCPTLFLFQELSDDWKEKSGIFVIGVAPSPAAQCDMHLQYHRTPMRRGKLISVLVVQQTVAYHMLVPELQPAHQNFAPMDS